MKTQEDVWLEEVPELIRKSQALQYFFQTFFENTGIYGQAPVDINLTQRSLGQRDVALDVKNIFDTLDPLLFHELMLARAEYLTQHPSRETLED